MQISRKALYVVLIVAGLLGLIDTVILLGFFDVSFNLGVILPGLAGLVLIIVSFYKLQNEDSFRIRNRKLKYYLVALLLVWLISFIGIEIMLLTGQKSDLSMKVDYLIVLGAGLKGEKMSSTLKSRIDRALNYLEGYPDTKVIVSGGQGPGEDITEAEAMRRYLVANGIADNRVIKEEKSTSTIENLRLSKKIVAETSKKNEIIIVTSDYHMLRAKMLAKRAGLTSYSLPSRTPYYVIVNSYLREYFAIIKSFILDR
ncbi:MAG: YdcF family protein [Firmicutes bacterium HGW-Firmicutes-14]|jgi:uncharacterized SAM-binding protein YcdF (DUF218 family)|nr:MAG: YdcF family protein [Firmicutes bacterium HGW-Firmicutes-14]